MKLIKEYYSGRYIEAFQIADIERVVANCHSLLPSLFYFFTDFSNRKIKIKVDSRLINFTYDIPFTLTTILKIDPATKESSYKANQIAICDDDFKKFEEVFKKFDDDISKLLNKGEKK